MNFIILIASICFIIKSIYDLIQYFIDKKEAKKSREYWQPIYKKRRQEWYGTCESCGTTDGLHRFQGKKYCASCYARIKTEYEFSKQSKQGETMPLNKILDESIKLHEIKNNSNITAGYTVNGRTYHNYVSNSSWELFCEDMRTNHPEAYENYKNGDGKELDVRKVGANTYPPKMASFGSSSRFIYNLMKDDYGFCFEEQLPTTVGGTANLDGFKKTEKGYVFVEAKCKEPYSEKNNIFGQKYKKLYDYITACDKTTLSCHTDLTKGKEHEMEVVFKYGDKEIKHFDIKQMISHLLGIGTAFLSDRYEISEIHFIYLLFNPTKIAIENAEAKIQIESIYNNICDVCADIDFKNLFEVILEFLHNEKGLGKNKNVSDITENFTFDLCDQDSFVSCANN